MSFLTLRRIPLYFKKLSWRVSLHDMTLLPFAMILCLVMYVTLSLSEMEMPLVSYGVLAAVLASFAFMLTLVVMEREMTKFGFLHLLYFLMFIAITLVSGTDVRNAIYNSICVWLTLLVMRYYRHRMDMVVKCFCIAFSVCIYINFLHVLTHPMLWLVQDNKDITGYLLGGNYNQMGCRMLVGLATNLLSLRYSKLWLLNFVALSATMVATLAMVGSMTSLSMISLLVVYCLVPSSRLRKIGICGLFAVFVLFQVFVVFNGRGLENNELAVYVVEDVLQKDLTFTNRTSMWDSALDIIVKSPIWGWGYPDGDWYRANMEASAIGPHNFILSILINGGVILMSLYIAICAMTYRSMRPYTGDSTFQRLLFATACLWVMSLMEMYPYPIMMYPLALLYYYKYYAENDTAATYGSTTDNTNAREYE